MSVTKDYDLIAFTAGERQATRKALMLYAKGIRETIDFLGPMGYHTSLVRELNAELADLQTALMKVAA